MKWVSIVEEAFNKPTSSRVRLIFSLLFITIVTAIIMTIFQIAKDFLDTDITVQESHLYTIVFVTILAPIIAFYILLKFDALYKRANAELQERKISEDKLRKNEASLSKSQEMAHIGSWEQDVATGEIERSAESYRIFGFKPGESKINYGDFMGLIVPEDRERVDSGIRLTKETGEPYTITYNIRRRDGVVRTLMSHGEVTRDSSGRVMKLYGTNQDITERKRAEEALRESERKFRAIFDQTLQFTGLLTTDGTLLEANSAALAFIGAVESDVIGKPFWETPWWNHSPRMQAQVKEAVKKAAKGEIGRFEAVLRASDGRLFYFDFSLKPVVDEDGNVTLLIPEARDITKRKLAEETLSKNLAVLAKSQEIGHLGSWTLDFDTGRLEMSEEELRIHGLAPGAVAVMDLIWPMIYPDDMERFREYYYAVREEGRLGSLEYRIVWPDKSVHYLHTITDSVVRGPDGQVKTSSGITQDITERRQVEDALREREADLILAQRIARVGSYNLDIAADMARCTEEFYRILGLEPQDHFSYNRFLTFVHPEDRESFNDTMQKAWGLGQMFKLEFRVVRQDGEVRALYADGNMVVDDTGQTVRMFGIIQDITERRLFDEKLRENYRFTSVLLGNLPGMVFRCRNDEDWTMEFLSRGCLELTGYKVEDLFNNRKISYVQLIHPDDRERVSNEVQKSFRDNMPFVTTYRITTASGEEKWVWTQGRRLFSKGKEIIEGYAMDITDTMLAEEALNEAKQQVELYLDLMGHDIRNMNMIGMGFLELALGSPDIKKEDKELLLKSFGSLENSTRLIDNVRKLQKARSGEQTRYDVDVCKMIMRVLAHYSNMPGIRASFNYELPSSCMVKADDLLYEVFENIVGNAIKHGGPEPAIDIRFETVDQDGRVYNRFTVEDNGPGIPDAVKDRIFNRLQRGDSKVKGTGLGLYLVRSLVESYGGRVQVEDRVAGDHTKGARFVVMLPAVE